MAAALRGPVASGSFALALGPIEAEGVAVAATEPDAVSLDSIAVAALADSLEAAAASPSGRGAVATASFALAVAEIEPEPVSPDATVLAALAGTLEIAIASPLGSSTVGSASFALALGSMDAEIVIVATIEQEAATLDGAAFAALADSIETAAAVAVQTRPVRTVMVAAIQSVPIPRMSTPAPSTTSDLSRLRAEVEAEIERDRARLAQAVQDCAKVGAPQQGCAIATPPKRFSLGV
jgi:hypothetical protein